MRKYLEFSTFKDTFVIPIRNRKINRGGWRDSLAQLVEHNTFNVGVSGSSPERITKQDADFLRFCVLLP